MEINLENISFSYKKINYQERAILKDINLNLKEGINVFIGENGSGKTTLLDIINFELEPTYGLIKIKTVKNFNNDLNRIKNKIGYAKEELIFISNNVKEELELAMIMHNYKIKEKRIYDVLLMLGLNENILNKKINKLSDSEKKKLSIACALIYNPDLLILDNPTQYLDVSSKNQLIKLLRIMKKKYKKNIIIASNDMEFIHQVADTIYVLNKKKIVLEGDKYFVFKQEKKLEKYGVSVPNIIKFENLVLSKKKIKLGYRDEMNDLIKDIYRYVK